MGNRPLKTLELSVGALGAGLESLKNSVPGLASGQPGYGSLERGFQHPVANAHGARHCPSEFVKGDQFDPKSVNSLADVAGTQVTVN